MIPEEILRKEKYSSLKGLLLICDAMDEYAQSLKEENERQQSQIKRLTDALRSSHDEAQNWFNQKCKLEEYVKLKAVKPNH